MPALHPPSVCLPARFDVIGPTEPVLAAVGNDAELPCRLSPNVSATHMELHWFREAPSWATLLHRDPQGRAEEPAPEFRGRVTLEADSIAEGRAAARIHRVRAADEGDYRCLFRDDTSSGEAAVRLRVAGERKERGFRSPRGVPGWQCPMLWKSLGFILRIPFRLKKNGKI